MQRTPIDRLLSAFSKGFMSSLTRRRTVGAEDELPVIRPDGSMGSTDAVLRNITTRGWDPIMEHGVLSAVTNPRFGTITTDAGLGTLEINYSPCATLHELSFKREDMLDLVEQAAHRSGQLIYYAGVQPVTPPHRSLWQQKPRYPVFVLHLTDMVDWATVTASSQTHVQITLDEVIPVTNCLNAMAGIGIALCANSSVHSGGLDEFGRTAVREEFWDELGYPDRVGIPEAPFTSLESYITHLARQRLLLYTVNGTYHTYESSLLDYLNANELSDSQVHHIFSSHEGSCWHPSRPRMVFGTAEYRPLDLQPRPDGMAPHALTTGWVENWQNCLDLIRMYPWSLWRTLRTNAIRNNLSAFADGVALKPLAQMALRLAYGGLRQRGLGEEVYLRPLLERAMDYEQVPAERAKTIFMMNGIPGMIREFASSGVA